ncbi:2Fe-2S iron-sulfur cluster binding domain-containing protein [Chloroflexi bacterium CFX6]|nr:2Fe-2S iron-sulfur cluster binding domain-containing protein [Chloroflexi bacterium CFX6]
MRAGKGQVVELILKNGRRQARISCASDLIPAPGQYLLAGDASDSPLPVPLFSTHSTADGFIAAAPIPDSWAPGVELYLRGPLGRGFELPVSARRVALVAFEDSPSRLRGLIAPALNQGAAVALVCDSEEEPLPDEVEVQPFSALDEVLAWADYAAFDAARENLPGLRERLGDLNQMSAGKEAQALIHTPIPCGGIAECGVCAVTLKSGWRLACREGPVFDLRGI